MQPEIVAITEEDVTPEQHEYCMNQLDVLRGILVDCLHVLVSFGVLEKESDPQKLDAMKQLMNTAIKVCEKNKMNSQNALNILRDQKQGDYIKLLVYIQSLCDSLVNFQFLTRLTNEHDVEAALGNMEALREALEKQMDDLKRDVGRPRDPRINIIESFVVGANKALLEMKNKASAA